MKEKTKNIENKRIYILLGVTVGIIIAVILSMVYGKTRSAKLVEGLEKLMASNEPKAVYLMRETCTYCELNKSNMNSIVKEYNFDYYNIDTDNLTKDDYDKVLTMLDIDKANFGTPTLVTVQNNEVVSNFSGLRTYPMLFNYLKENKLIKEDTNLYLNYVTLDTYKDLFNSDKPEVIVLATSYCKFCLAEHPVLIDVAKETNAKINYVYLDYLFENQEQYDEFMGSLSWFSENTNWGTPTTLIVKNNEVIDVLNGYREKKDIIDFYKKNGIIEV